MKLQYQTYWQPRALHRQIDAVGGLRAQQRGSDPEWKYVNVQRLFSRLQDVKRTWDAANLFHHKQSIQLP